MKSSSITTHSLTFKVVLVLVLAIVSVLLLRTLVASKEKDKEQPAAAVSKKSLANGSTDLASRIDSVIDESNGVARWGISVVSMVDGSKFYERDGDKLFTPASNMKIYTTGVA